MTALLLTLLLAVARQGCTRGTEIPEDFFIRMEAVQNFSQFLNKWIDQAAIERAYLFQDDVEVAYPAGCVPEMQIVEFERPADPSLVLWPVCTRVRRCSGCCSSKLLHCVPTRTSTITRKVIRARYPRPGADKLELVGHETVRLEQHDRCTCKCRQEERDCNPLQRYQPGHCRCACRHFQDCKQPGQFWDTKECLCKCRSQADCSTGSTFSNSSCKCESQNPILPEGIFPHLSTILRDGEKDKLRYSPYVGPFAVPHYMPEYRTKD